MAVLALVLAGLSAACEHRGDSAPAPSASVAASTHAARPDPNADGRRLARAESSWRERWRSADVPDCAALLSETAERERCVAAVAAKERLRAALEQGTPTPQLLPLIAETALSAQRATQVLRASGVAELFAAEPDRVHAAASARVPSPSGSAAARSAAAPVASGKPARSAVPAASAAPLVRRQQSAALDAITAYARVATLALRELGMYLELGPLPLRNTAFLELARLCDQEPHWAGLHALVDEATLVEPDPELKKKLVALQKALGPV